MSGRPSSSCPVAHPRRHGPAPWIAPDLASGARVQSALPGQRHARWPTSLGGNVEGFSSTDAAKRRASIRQPTEQRARQSADAHQTLCVPSLHVAGLHDRNIDHGAHKCLGRRNHETFAENKGNQFP